MWLQGGPLVPEEVLEVRHAVVVPLASPAEDACPVSAGATIEEVDGNVAQVDGGGAHASTGLCLVEL